MSGAGPDTTPTEGSIEDRIAELEAAVAALEAYVGQLERVDDALERRANAAVAAVARLEETDLDADAVPTEAGLPATDSVPDLDDVVL